MRGWSDDPLFFPLLDPKEGGADPNAEEAPDTTIQGRLARAYSDSAASQVPVLPALPPLHHTFTPGQRWLTVLGLSLSASMLYTNVSSCCVLPIRIGGCQCSWILLCRSLALQCFGPWIQPAKEETAHQ